MGHFQKAVSITLAKVVKRMRNTCVLFYYVDDVLVGSDSVAEHLKTLKIILDKLPRDKSRTSKEKSKWCCESRVFRCRIVPRRCPSKQ